MSEAGIKLVNLPRPPRGEAFDDGSVMGSDGTVRLAADTTLAYRQSSFNNQVA
ncbi:hypothetical protein [Sinorhizobium meliloti]|uniref:hypothetical protein n=1 Tax=Rhizobium meliloti TaxID=382 RepID=UPI001294F7AA|nr:hypothetical protein [Sinorhizobium meliloti]MCO5964804.1 hypothetical protein [Sinorhizobium meliloti]MDE3857853.1 hypothetical protein [Sinorhizobium meliloti]MQW49320.1 hypothetical protein [Sinorhizobium meliloti]